MDLINVFKIWLEQEQKLSVSTIRVYLSSIRHFLKYHEEDVGIKFNKLEKEMVDAYTLFMLELKNIPQKTINTRVASLAKFNEFLVQKNFQKEIVIHPSNRTENEIITGYKDWLQHNQFSKGTLDVYLASVRNFFRYYSDSFEKEFTKLDSGVVNGYKLKLEMKNVPPRTINSRITALKKFNEFLVEKGVQNEIVVEPSHRIEDNYLSVEKEFVNAFDVNKFLAAVKEGGSKRDVALVLLLKNTQMQVKEIIKLKVSDYHNGVIIQKTKDNKELAYHINNELMKAIENYINEREGLPFADSDFLFITNKGGQIDKRQIYLLFNMYSQQANLLSPITPRKLSEFELKKELTVKENGPQFEFQFGKSFMLNIDIDTDNFELNGMTKAKVVLSYEGAQRVFLFGLVNPEWIQSLLLIKKVFVPKGLFIVHSVHKERIYEHILDTFYIHDDEEVHFLNQLESYSLNEQEISDLEVLMN